MNILIDIPPSQAAEIAGALGAADRSLAVACAPDAVAPGWADCLLTWAPSELVMSRLSPRGFIQAYGAGVDRILAARRDGRETPVARLVDPAMSAGMAQYVTHAILDWVRGAPIYRRQQAAREWRRQPHPDPAAFPVGILGLGELGRATKIALEALGFPVEGWSRRNDPASFDAFLARTRILVSLLPATAQTRGMIDLPLLRKLPSSSFVVSCGRGEVLVAADLIAAIDEGRVAGAALDVFESEPLPPESPLWAHPGVTVTPHIATFPIARAVVRQVVENVGRHRRGERLQNQIDPSAGY